MAYALNNFEEGTSGTTLTTGNTDGVSSQGFDTIFIGTGATLAFDSTHAAHGGLSMKVAIGSTATEAEAEWSTTIGTQTTVYFRCYLYLTSNPSGVIRFFSAYSSATFAGFVGISTSGHVILGDSTFAIKLTFTGTVPLNQWFRIEGFITGNASTGSVTASQYNLMDSTTADETKTVAGLNTIGSLTTYIFGQNNNVATVGPFWMDDIGVSSSGLIGPATASIVNAWSAVYTELSWQLIVDDTTAGEVVQPDPQTLSLEIPVSNAAGDWMVCCMTWQTLTAVGFPVAPTMSVADDVHNWWEPVAQNITSSADGYTRSSIWVAPAAKAASTVYIAPSGYTIGLAATVYDVTGILPWFTASAFTNGFANIATNLSMTVASPSSSAIIFTVAGADDFSQTYALAAGDGWSGVTVEDGSNGENANIVCISAYQVTGGSGSVTAVWSSSGTVNFSGATAGFLIQAPALTAYSPMWPVIVYECAPGFGFQSTPDDIAWTALTAQALKLDITQGRQYEVAQLSAGEGTLLLDNPLGMLIPPGSGSFAGLDSGTPVRVRTAWQGGAWQVQWYGNGTTSQPKAESFSTVPVIIGQSYCVSAWIGSSVTWSGGMNISIAWKTSGGSFISSSPSTAVTGPAPQLVTATGTAPPTAAKADLILVAQGTPPASTAFYGAAAFPGAAAGSTYMTIAPATVWTAENNATVSVLAPWSPDPRGEPNITPWYVPYSGFIERLPQQWDENLRGKTDAAITDAWFGCNFVPNPIMFDEILNDFPYAYWPCVDAAGAGQASNFALGNTNPLIEVTSKYGVGTAVADFGQNAQALLGAQVTTIVSTDLRVTSGGGMWGQSGLGTGSYSASSLGLQGYSLQCIDSNFPQIGADGVTIEMWFQFTSLSVYGGIPPTDNFYQGTLWTLADSNFGFLNLSIEAIGTNNPTGTCQLVTSFVGTSDSTNIGTDVGNFIPGQIYQTVMSFTQTEFSLYVNGGAQYSAQNLSFGAGGLKSSSFTTIVAAGGSNLNFASGTVGWIVPPPQGSWNGFAGHIAIYPYLLSENRILTHYLSGIQAMQQESASNRFERLLQIGLAPGRRVIMQEPEPDTNAVVSCQDVSGQPMSAAIDNIAGDLLPGMFLIAPTGDLYYLSKLYSWNQGIKWVLGEDVFSGEYSYLNDITFDYDVSRVINEIQLTQLDNQDVIVPTVTAIETASQNQYGTISDLATGYLYGDNTVPYTYGPGLQDTANWLACAYRAPQLRLTTIKINAASNPGLWEFVLGAAVGDTVTVNRRSLGQASIVIQVTGRITQTTRTFEYSIKGAEASIECVIDPMPEENALTCDDPVRGLLNGTDIFGW
jgi:hypothetical protein